MTINENGGSVTVTSARPDSSTYHITYIQAPANLRNNGIGSTLLWRAEDYARTQGAVAVMLLATASTVAWFTRRGYTFVCRCDEDRSLTYLTKIL